ncbi:MAG: hypothetical protein NZ890_07470 [Myxococcota bacterium]|nr:hypothetical protein [Myxococcota bacterium]
MAEAREPRTEPEENDATVEVEQLDPGEVLPPSPALQNLVGPLEGRGPESERTLPLPRMPTRVQVTRPVPRASIAASAWWLVPLGLTSAAVLGLALWVLLQGP